MLDGGRLVLRIEPGQEFCEIAHLLVTVLDKAFARGIREESTPRLRVRREFWGIEVSQPEAATHFTAIVCVSAEMNEVTCPDRRVQRAYACAHGSRHTGFREPRHVKIFGRIAEVNSELLKLASDVFVNVVSPSDEVAAANFVDPFTPDMVFGMPPFVLFSCFKEVEPPFDHTPSASEH